MSIFVDYKLNSCTTKSTNPIVKYYCFMLRKSVHLVKYNIIEFIFE